MNDTLCVAYSSDDGYAKFLGISLLSLLKSNRDFERVRAFVLDCGIGEENREKLRALAEGEGREISFIPMGEAVGSLQLKLGAHKIAAASYARLFLSSVLPADVDRVLYVDCDTLVRRSLRPLWETDLGRALIAGCQDTVDGYFLKKIRLEEKLPYINAGVLLIPVKAWREEGLSERFFQVIREFDGNVPHHDQGVVNASCGDRRLRVSPAYNLYSNLYSFPAKTVRRMYGLKDFYSQAELDQAISDPVIVHFTSGLVGRPWEENCAHPMREEFWQAVKQSPWADLPMKPDSRSRGLKLFIAFYRAAPRPLFEAVYRCMNWALHLRK